MMKFRLVIRALLVCLLLAAGYLGYRVWIRHQPDFYWNCAQVALSENDLQAARLYLENLLDRHPEHAQGHRALADILLREAKPQGQPSTYATHRRALNHLDDACRLMPDDIDLQKDLLKARLARREATHAAEAAVRIVAVEPDNADALYALAWDAVESRDGARADPLLTRLERLTSLRPFSILGLAARLHVDTKRPQRLQQTLRLAAGLAARLDCRTYAALSRDELGVMHSLLLAAVQQAPDLPTAESRAAEALQGLQTLSAANRESAGDLADRTANLMQSLAARRPSPAGAPSDRLTRPSAMEDKAEQIRAAAVVAGEGGALVYRQSAQFALDRGRPTDARDIIRRGLAAARQGDQRRALLDLHLLAARLAMQTGRMDDAQPHLQALLAQPDSAGWGHLLSGAVAIADGRAEKAYEHFVQARSALGNLCVVRVGLANALFALAKYQEAATEFRSLRAFYGSFTAEERDWAARFFGPGEHWIVYSQLLSELNLKHWDAARAILTDLRGSELEARGEAAVVSGLLGAGEKSQARTWLNAARTRLPRAKELLRAELAVLEAEGKGGEAEQLLESLAATAPPEEWQHQLLMVEWFIRHGQVQRALKHVESLESRPFKADAFRETLLALKAMALTAQGKADEAVRLLEPLRFAPRTAAMANLLTAAAEMRLHHGEKAAQSLAAARQTDPRNAMLTYLDGELAKKRGDYAKAAECLGASLDVTALRDRVGALVGELLLDIAEQRSVDEADTVVDGLLRQSPRDPVLLAAKAELQLQRGEFAAAIALLDRAERSKPGDAANAARKATAWLRAGQAARALAEARHGLLLDKRHAPCLVAAAQANLVANKPGDALPYAEAALRENPKLAAAIIVRAETLARLDRRKEAVASLAALVAEQPRLVEAHRALAQVLTTEGKFDAAIEAYRTGRRERPDSLALLAGEVELLAARDRMTEARQLAGLSVEKPAVQKFAALGRAFELAGKLDEAETWLTRGLSAVEEQQRAQLQFLLANNALKRHREHPERRFLEQAKDRLAAVVAADPNHLLAANNLAWLLATEFERSQEAAALVDRLRRQAVGGTDRLPAELVHTGAVVYRLAGRPTEARRILEESLAQRPEQPVLWLELGITLADGKKPQEARSPLKRALELGLSDSDAKRAKRLLEQLDAAAVKPGSDPQRPGALPQSGD